MADVDLVDPKSTVEVIPVARIIHTIHVVKDLVAARELYFEAFGALMFVEGYHEGEDRDMALMYVADHQIEPVAARNIETSDKNLARFTRKYGEGWHSFEIKVPSAAAAAAAFKARGMRVTNEYWNFFFTHPSVAGGVPIEVCETPMRNDPYDRSSWNPDWGRGHASGMRRLNQIACVSRDLDAPRAFFTEATNGQLLADEVVSAPQPGRRLSLRVGHDKVTFTRPDDLEGGPLGAFLGRPNMAIYALVWDVDDLAKAEAHFHRLGLRTTREGCIAGAFAIEPSDMMGARYEFLQAAR